MNEGQRDWRQGRACKVTVAVKSKKREDITLGRSLVENTLADFLAVINTEGRDATLHGGAEKEACWGDCWTGSALRSWWSVWEAGCSCRGEVPRPACVTGT